MADAMQDLRQETREVANLTARLREMCGEDDQAFIDTLDGETEAVEAARRVLRWMHEQDANHAACKELESVYRGRAEAFKERQMRGKTALFHFLCEMGLKSMPLPEGTLSLRAGSVSVIGDADPALLAPEFVRVKREPDRAAIKAALEAGKAVDGFSLSNNPPTLTVRVR